MPAAAVASFTPESSGMSGISVGASGETADDMRTSGFEAKEALLITSIVRVGEGVQCVHHSSSPRKRGPITTVVQYLRRQLAACPNAKARRDGVDGPLRHRVCQNEVVEISDKGAVREPDYPN